MPKHQNSARRVSASDITTLANQINSELSRIWNVLNTLQDKNDEAITGDVGQACNTSTIRLVQTKNGAYIEGKFSDGWRRLETSLSLLDKKE